MMEAHILCLWLALLFFCTVSSEMTWQNGDENGSATLVCPFEMQMQWVTPTKMVVQPQGSHDTTKYIFDSSNTSTLTITKLSASDAGTYICGIPVGEDDDREVRQIELHVKLPYHDSYYGDNAITGVVVAAIVALLFGGSCLLYKYRYQEKSFTDMEVVTVDYDLKHQKMKSAEELPMKTDSSPILENRPKTEGRDNLGLDSDSDDEPGRKIPLDVTSEDGHKGSGETAETGM